MKEMQFTVVFAALVASVSSQSYVMSQGECNSMKASINMMKAMYEPTCCKSMMEYSSQQTKAMMEVVDFEDLMGCMWDTMIGPMMESSGLGALMGDFDSMKGMMILGLQMQVPGCDTIDTCMKGMMESEEYNAAMTTGCDLITEMDMFGSYDDTEVCNAGYSAMSNFQDDGFSESFGNPLSSLGGAGMMGGMDMFSSMSSMGSGDDDDIMKCIKPYPALMEMMGVDPQMNMMFDLYQTEGCNFDFNDYMTDMGIDLSGMDLDVDKMMDMMKTKEVADELSSFDYILVDPTNLSKEKLDIIYNTDGVVANYMDDTDKRAVLKVKKAQASSVMSTIQADAPATQLSGLEAFKNQASAPFVLQNAENAIPDAKMLSIRSSPAVGKQITVALFAIVGLFVF